MTAMHSPCRLGYCVTICDYPSNYPCPLLGLFYLARLGHFYLAYTTIIKTYTIDNNYVILLTALTKTKDTNFTRFSSYGHACPYDG